MSGGSVAVGSNFLRQFRLTPWIASAALVFIGAVGWSIIQSSGIFSPGPPIDIQITARTDGAYVEYRIDGVRLTSRDIERCTASWVFDTEDSGGRTVTIPTDIFNSDGDVLICKPIYTENDEIHTQWLRVAVIDGVYTDTGASLKLCWDYEGHSNWCAEPVLFVDMQGYDTIGAARSIPPSALP